MRTVLVFGREAHEGQCYAALAAATAAHEEAVASANAAYMGTIDLAVKGSAVRRGDGQGRGGGELRERTRVSRRKRVATRRKEGELGVGELGLLPATTPTPPLPPRRSHR